MILLLDILSIAVEVALPFSGSGIVLVC